MSKWEQIGKILGVVVALILIGTYSFTLYKTIQENKSLLGERMQEASFLNPLQELQNEKRQYQTLSIKVATNLYTNPRLFNLYKGFENEFGRHFYSVSINPNYTLDKNRMKWFYLTIQVNNMKPQDFFGIVQKEIPPLYVDSFQISSGRIIAVLKGMINTQKDNFVITPQLYNTSKYLVCKLYAVTNNPAMEQYFVESGYYVVKKSNQYYAGKVVTRNLDALTAEAVANSYSGKGTIVMVVKEVR